MIGLSLLAVGAAIFILLGALLLVIADIGEDPLHRTALRAIFWSLMHVLNVTAKLLMIVGASVGLAAAIAGNGTFEERMRGIGRAGGIVLSRPRTKAIAAALTFAAGLLGLIWPLAAAILVTRVAAVGLLTAGAVWVFDLVGASHWATATDASQSGGRRLALTLLVSAAVVPVFLVVGGMAFVRALRPPVYTRIDADPNSCNGSPVLCDRRLDQVAFAGTHNSMSAESDGYIGAHQAFGLLAQLTGGVRAFLVDLHYGGKAGGKLTRTDLEGRGRALGQVRRHQSGGAGGAQGPAPASGRRARAPRRVPVPRLLRGGRHSGTACVQALARMARGERQPGCDPGARGPRVGD